MGEEFEVQRVRELKSDYVCEYPKCNKSADLEILLEGESEPGLYALVCVCKEHEDYAYTVLQDKRERAEEEFYDYHAKMEDK